MKPGGSGTCKARGNSWSLAGIFPSLDPDFLGSVPFFPRKDQLESRLGKTPSPLGLRIMNVLIAGKIVQRTVCTVILVVTNPKSLCKGQTVKKSQVESLA